MLISLKNAGIYRSDRWLVRGVSMTIDAGEIVTLIGPNGSGKSTTAKMALGILRTDEGSASQKPNLRTSYAPQKLEVKKPPKSTTRSLAQPCCSGKRKWSGSVSLLSWVHSQA